MKPFDPALASPFRVEWLVPMDETSQDDFSRAVAEKAVPILRAARYMSAQQQGDTPVDMEIRVWIEAATAPGCVSITWEPGANAFAFHLLDETLRDRLAVVVFRDIPCIDADASDQQADDILRAAMQAIRDAEERAGIPELAERVREATRANERTVRVPVIDVQAAEFDSGVEP